MYCKIIKSEDSQCYQGRFDKLSVTTGTIKFTIIMLFTCQPEPVEGPFLYQDT